MLEDMQRQGFTPKALKEKPILSENACWFYNAFALLHRGRAIGFSQNPIPLTEMECYLRICKCNDPDFALMFVRLIAELDEVYLDWVDKQNQKKKT